MFINYVNLIGNDYYNYVIDASGFSYATVTPAPLTSNFYSLDKVYDRNNYAPVYYSLSGFFPSDIGGVDISEIWFSTFRDVNVNYNIPIDISNIIIYGYRAFNYSIPYISTISGLISKKYLYVVGNDKNYDSNIVATITISGIIPFDLINYIALYNDKHSDSNKLVTVTLSDNYNTSYAYTIDNNNNIITATYSTFSMFYNISGYGANNFTITNYLHESNNNYQLYNKTTTANIFQRYLKATFYGINKVYNSVTD
jgi:hypothetical protein